MDESVIIKNIATSLDNDYIGDDCAYLKDLGIVITQDNLVENIHFKREWYTPYQLGYKSAVVNISDILASGACPAYLTLGLSMPSYLGNDFVNEFIQGMKDGSYGAEVCGGDITGSKNGLFISVTAVGSVNNRRISSRKNAKEGYVIVVSGEHGTSSAGLRELLNSGTREDLIISHLMPVLDIDFSEKISKNIKSDYAMMDSSDGLGDALFKIAEASGVKIEADYSLIPHKQELSYNDVILGGEDYKLIAAVPPDFAEMYDLTVIGNVLPYDGIRLNISGKCYKSYSELNVYKHFED